MGNESLRALAANLKEASEALDQQIRENEVRELEETLQLKTFPSHFWWRLAVPSTLQTNPVHWYLCGTPVTKAIGDKIVDCCVSNPGPGDVVRVLGKLFGIESVWHSGLGTEELFIRMPPEKLLEFIKRDDVHLRAGTTLEESIMELVKRQEELKDQRRLVFEYLDCLHAKGGDIGVNRV